MSHIADNPAALAALVEGLGAEVIHGEVFDIKFPRGMTKEIVPKLDQVGVGVTKLEEYVGTNPRTGRTENVVVCRAYRKDHERSG